MCLLVDIGNSRVKWAIQKQGRLHHGEPFLSSSAGLDGRFGHYWDRLARPDHVMVSSVGGCSVDAILRNWVQCHWRIPVEFVQSAAASHGVVNGYSEPRKLGVDRWVCLVAVRSMVESDACIVDCGTAITLDILDSSGQHEGGLIIPGLHTMKQSLIQETNAIGDVPESGSGLLGRNTDNAIHIGTLLAVRGMILTVLRQIDSSHRGKTELILTGGDAEQVADAMDLPSQIYPDLVLRGLAVLHTWTTYSGKGSR